MAAAGMSQAGLARACGVAAPSVHGWLSGKSKFLRGENLLRASKALGVRPAWLAEGTGPMHLSVVDQPGATNDGVQDQYVDAGLMKTRRLYVVGRSDNGTLPERVWKGGLRAVGATEAYAEIATDDESAFLVEVIDTAMTPRYNQGEFALVEPCTEPEIEDDVLVRLKTGETLLRRLASRRGGYRFGTYNGQETIHIGVDGVSWVYYVPHPIPRRKVNHPR